MGWSNGTHTLSLSLFHGRLDPRVSCAARDSTSSCFLSDLSLLLPSPSCFPSPIHATPCSSSFTRLENFYSTSSLFSIFFFFLFSINQDSGSFVLCLASFFSFFFWFSLHSLDYLWLHRANGMFTMLEGISSNGNGFFCMYGEKVWERIFRIGYHVNRARLYTVSESLTWRSLYINKIRNFELSYIRMEFSNLFEQEKEIRQSSSWTLFSTRNPVKSTRERERERERKWTGDIKI